MTISYHLPRYIESMPETAQAIAYYIDKLEARLTDEQTTDNDLLREKIASAQQDLQRALG